MIPEDESSRSAGVQYATGEEQRAITNSFRKNEMDRPKRKWHSVVDMTAGESKVQWYKEEYYMGTWNGILDMVKQEMARLGINILK